MLVLATLSLAPLALSPPRQERALLTDLRVGETVEGELTDGDEVVHTPTLDAGYTQAPTVGRTFALQVGESGPYHLDLRSYLFDAYLVLRDGEGNLLAEDDDGLIGLHSRITVELKAGESYGVQACALHGQRGEFELTAMRGRPPAWSPAERARAQLEDAERRVAVLEAELGPEHADTVESLNQLAVLLQEQNDYGAARSLFERVLAIRERTLGPEHPYTATSLNYLAAFLDDRGDHAAARPLYERALAIYENTLGPDHPSTATNLSNLAGLLKAQGEYDSARPLYERAIAIHEDALGVEHPQTARSLNNLVSLLKAQGDYAAAMPLCVRALAIREKVLGPEHLDTAKSLNSLAGLLNAQGDYDAARPLYERALAIRQKLLGDGHPSTAVSLNNLATLLEAQGDRQAARRLYERALAIWEKTLGAEHLQTARGLENLARLLHSQGDYDAAEPLYERALAIFEEVLGADHPETASTRTHVARLLKARGDYDAARSLYERALLVHESTLGPDHPHTAASLDKLAAVLVAQGDYDAAKPLYERALAIRERVLGREHPDNSVSLNGLALLLYHQGEYDAARPLYERALAIDEEAFGPVHFRTATSLNNLAALLKEQGDYRTARSLYERSLAILEEVLGPVHVQTATCLNNLATLFEFEGDLDAARPRYERSLAIYESVLGAEHPDTARSLNTLGLLLRAQGEYDAARQLYERALAINENALGAEHPDTARTLNNLGALLEGLGDLDAAGALYERALAISEKVLGPEHPYTATSLNSLALLYSAQGDHETARSLCKRSLAIRERVFGPGHPSTASALNNLAVVLYAQGDYDAARPLYERALAIREEALGKEHPRTASSLGNLALVLYAQGAYGAARQLGERALAILEEVLGPDHPDTALRLYHLAVFQTDLDELPLAWATLRSGHGWRLARRSRVLTSLSEAERYGYLATLFAQLEFELSLSGLLGEPAAGVVAYEDLLGWKGHVGRTLLDRRAQLSAAVSPEQRELLAQLRASQTRLSALAFATEVRDPQAYQTALRDAREERNRIELELERAMGASAAESGLGSFAALSGALPRRSAVLDFFVHHTYEPARREDGEVVELGRWRERRVSVWITRPGSEQPVRLDLGSAESLRQAVRLHLGRITGRAEGAAGEGVEERRLESLLWDPIAPHLDGAELVYVSPDAFLATLPFETLQLEDASFAVERFAFVYLQDLGLLGHSSPADEPELDSLLSVGAVDFGRRSDWEREAEPAQAVEASASRGSFRGPWPALTATARESRVVFDLHESTFGASGRRTLLQGPEATEERLKHELQRHSLLHLATHGFFNPEGERSLWEAALGRAEETRSGLLTEGRALFGKHPGLLSGLVCAGANTESPAGRDDGYLTAEEVGWLDLSGVELVVLSACETALGREQSGEGLMGLRRACRTAGAETVISSLWSVGDDSTASFMRAFYANLLERRMGRLEALREAQLSLLQSNREQYGEALPRTWGAFVLSGEWR